MQKIIKIESVPKYFSIIWRLNTFCNYDCMYCPKEWHDNFSKPRELEDLKQSWKNVHEKSQHLGLKYKISFTGGEVTANKNFLPFVEWLRGIHKNNIMILVTSNGSASQRYYTSLAKLVDSISFSFHSEFANEKEFFSKCIQTHRDMFMMRKGFHVNIMDERWNRERISKYQTLLSSHKINYTMNKIDYSIAIREEPVKMGVQNLEEITERQKL
jgi:MoaA/NifB/PqqE/SkfB family radical SAM enzyme